MVQENNQCKVSNGRIRSSVSATVAYSGVLFCREQSSNAKKAVGLDSFFQSRKHNFRDV